MSPRRVATLLIAANMVAAPFAFAQTRTGTTRNSAAQNDDEEDDGGDEEEEPAAPNAARAPAGTAHTTTTAATTQAASSSTAATTTQAETDFPATETEAQAEARRERMLPRFNSLDGSIGLLHMSTAEAGGDQSFRFSFIGEYNSFGNFLRPAMAPDTIGVGGQPGTGPDNSRHIGATFGLSYSPIRYVDVHLALRSYANYADTSTPHLFQVLGDTILGVKGFYPVARGLNIGVDISGYFLNRAGDIGLLGASTSATFRLLATLDLHQLTNSVPIRFHLNVGYFLDNSSTLVTSTEHARQLADPRYNAAACSGTPDTNPMSAYNLNPACHIEITREERYALGINRADRFNIQIGVDANLPYFKPFIEWNVSVPVVRSGYICYGVSTDSANSGRPAQDDDQCLAGAGVSSFAASPSIFTIGTRFVPPQIRGLSALLAFDIATGGSSVFVRELAPTPPWTMYFGAAYAHDFAPQIRHVDVPREVVREVRVDNTPIHGRIAGTITDAESHQPIAGAVIDLVGHPDLGYVASGPQGHFHTHDVPPAGYEVHVRAPDYNENTCRGTIPAPTGGAREVPDVTVDCALRPLPRMGNIGGHVTTTSGATAPGLTITLTPVTVTPPPGVAAPTAQTAVTGADGTFQFPNLPAGTYTVTAGQGPQSRAGTPHSIEVRPRETANGDLTVAPVDTTGITVARGALNVRDQVHFQTDSAEILPDSNTLLERIADVINRHPEIAHLEIQGHTDNQGNAPHNMQLSQARAESVRQRLSELGVTADRLTAHGYGQTRPIAPNLTAPGRARNRRVMFVITGRAPAAPRGGVLAPPAH